MTTPTIDPTNPDALLAELFDNDQSVKDQFRAQLSEPLHELCNALANCFHVVGLINDMANRAETQRNALVSGFAVGVLDDLVTSTKLLLTGKLAAAGNLMRQVIEGIAISILCSTDDLLVLDMNKKQGMVRARYWEKLWADDRRTEGVRAVQQLEWNAVALGIAAGAVQQLRRAKKHYNAFSHCGKVTIGSRMMLGEVGQIHLGGLFDAAKLDDYKAELTGRINLCRVLPPFLERLLASMSPPAARAAEARPPQTT
ncbi:hypothetical protein LJ656_34405 [Paraburkholderia sp. MMS20-SJTR3]|uniref:Uncharacterized protein n=1 Tax=Paraburkholderia sejongensis TaxID=2886946 RepID=A0ABS8K662_9BURK|nr:hypothetical protein [Paraburkholderia sp. MMS20-SJTR3]MCC8397636.1 hypothetical protein [Paraburkholderia sp. MMS20-SJTR3]